MKQIEQKYKADTGQRARITISGYLDSTDNNDQEAYIFLDERDLNDFKKILSPGQDLTFVTPEYLKWLEEKVEERL